MEVAKRIKWKEVARYSVLSAASIVTIYPIFWLITLAFRTRRDFVASPFGLPNALYIGNFIAVFQTELIRDFFINSILITGLTLVIVTMIGTLAGYTLSRYEFKGSKIIFLAFLMSRMIPVNVIVIPLYSSLSELGLLGERAYYGLIGALVSLTLGMTVFLSRGFFRGISQEILDAARLDGCTELKAFFYVMLPMARSGIVVLTILNFISLWNEYFLSLVIIPRQEMFTLPLGLTFFRGRYGTNYPQLSAAILLATIPTVLLYFFFQERIIRGVGESASHS